MQYFEIARKPRLEKFFLLSLLIHIVMLLIQSQATITTPEPLKPIKVKFIEPEKDPPPEKGSIVDAPKPRKIETPKTEKLFSSFNSRAHSNLKKSKTSQYRSRKTVVPKAERRRVAPQKKVQKHVRPQALKKAPPLPESDRGTHKKAAPQELEKTVPKTDTPNPGNLLAMLDGFDAEKYASIDTGDSYDDEDEEVISLDTKETKWADYFARIKHQIELVWQYPMEAASQGISGQMA
ncbi:MAG: hypothetical protein ACE5GQ_10100, partial [Nitrospinales bacterium]